MQIRKFLSTAIRTAKSRPKLSAAAGFGVLALLVFLVRLGSTPAAQPLSFYEVRRGDFLVSVVEGGTLEAVNEIAIRSEMEGTARIIFIVPEGSYVKKGELLVELDSSGAQDSVNQQQISVEKAQFALLQSEQQLAIQKSTVDSEVQAATLKVEFAESDLDKFVKAEALQMVRDAQIKITNTMENLQIAEERLEWSEKLYQEGFETKGNLDKDRLTVSQTTLTLEQAQTELWVVEQFDIPKRKRTLESALQEAKENLERVKLQGDRKLAQFEADVETQKKTLELSQAKLERERRQLTAAKIYAPQDGLVVYGSPSTGHFSSESMIEEGAIVRNRQQIIRLPDVTEMKVQVKIHESHINQIRLGLPAFVVLDSMPDLRFRGTVNRVAPLPDSQSRWGNPDLKLYATEIIIRDRLPDVKPGVSARAEILVTNLTDVVSVPIQSVTSLKGKQVVYLAEAPQTPVPVTVGLYNTKFIEVTTGLKGGERVLLAPPMDPKEKDLAGAIVADTEPIPAPVPLEPERPRPGNGTEATQARPGGTEPGAETALAASETIPNAASSSSADTTPGRRPRPVEDGSRTNRQEFLMRFDTDRDGTLSESEQVAMQNFFSRQREKGPRAPRNNEDTQNAR